MSVAASIAAHLAAVHADEASFTDDGIAIDEDLAARTGAAEAKAFADLLGMPCLSAADVQAKLDYVLNGTIGEREPNVSGILGDDGADTLAPDGPLMSFLNSLLTAAR